ncbi:hypothetical protein [Alkanindiges illinoisensis]|uniref:hypothetical protein n=1 Tax=Alkanindiges illinoisensis TaxID=197183 RepID=UPI00047DCA42|nr:hypothetical protein [Alkanindiges illinoisensis]
MAKLFKVFAFSTLALSFEVLSLQAAYAEDTIYTWTDEQESLTNYGGIPPEEELGSDAVKVIDLQKGITTKVDFPARAVDAAAEKNKQQLKPPAGYPAAAISAINPNAPTEAATPATSSAPKMLGSSTPVPPPSNTDQAKPAAQSGMLASGKASSFINEEEAKKLSEQENKLEEQAKSARRIALEKRRDEMKALAERVRNGAASRQEIAALMTYRQTASFGEARSALARPKTAKKVELND